MKAYVELVQRKEREIGTDVLTHQKVQMLATLNINLMLIVSLAFQWSGADYADNLIKTVTGGFSSTSAMGEGVTEAQFAVKSKM